MLVRLDHVADFIVNANHGVMLPTALLRVADCVRDGLRPGIPQPTERECIGNQIDAAFIFARADLVNVHC